VNCVLWKMTDIYPQKQLLENTTLHRAPLEIGQNKGKYDLLDHLEQKDFITKTISEKYLKVQKVIYKKKILKEKESSTQESPLLIKKKTSKDKSIISKENTQKTKLLKTLDPDSTGKETGLKPFWNEYTKDVSQKLWLPTKTDCVDLDLNCLSGSVKNHMLKSWFSIRVQKQKTGRKNSQKIYSQLSQSLLQKTTELEPLKIEKSENPKSLKTIKIKLNPNKEQRSNLNEWFGCYRFVYNKCIEYINKGERESGKGLKKQLRERFIQDKNYKAENNWMSLPADTRDCAAIEAYEKFTTNLNSGHRFKMTFKNKNQSQSIDIRRERQFNAKTNKSKYKFLSDIERTENLPELEHDIKIHKDIFEDFYLLVPVKLNRSESQTPNRIISLDPGIRTFFTGYTHDGYVYHLGENDISRICRLYHYKFKLQSRMDKCEDSKQKLKYKVAINKLSQKQKNLIDEAHKKISKWLLENFDFILIPKLDTNSFCRKTMNKKIKNKIKSWRHCSFLDRLKFKNTEYPGVYITSPTEEYTSKTCSNCGFINEQLGSNKTFNCPKCVKSFDRDVNAAKNILLKCLSKEL